MEYASSFIKKKLLKKQHVSRNKTSIVYYYSLTKLYEQLNSSYSDVYWISHRNVLKVKSKLLVFSFVPLVMWKVQKLVSINIQSNCKIIGKKRTDSSSVFTGSGKVQKGGDC